eukprot:2422472-Pyramimonas_sp.AAC.1
MSSTASATDYFLCYHDMVRLVDKIRVLQSWLGGPRKPVRLHLRPGVPDPRQLVYCSHARLPVLPPRGPRRQPRSHVTARALADQAARAAKYCLVGDAWRQLNHARAVFLPGAEMEVSDVLGAPLKTLTRSRCLDRRWAPVLGRKFSTDDQVQTCRGRRWLCRVRHEFEVLVKEHPRLATNPGALSLRRA